MTKFYNYEHGTELVAEAGKMRPFGDRILLRAIMFSEGYTGGLTLVEYNSNDAECFEVLAVGGNVARWCEEHGEDAPKPGQHCDIRSTAADRVAQRDPTGRYWLVPVMDVSAVWDPVEMSDEVTAAAQRIADRKANTPKAPAPSNGEAHLEPSYVAVR